MNTVTAKQFYTYFHTRNDTGKPFYVGKGCGDRAHHVNRNNPHWRNIVAKHGHTVHIASHWPTEGEAFEHEKFLILCFKDLGVKLANMTNGGEGISGLVHTPEAKAKISAASKSQMQSVANRERLRVSSTGRVHSEATRLKISQVLAGKKRAPLPEAVKAKLSAINIGKKLSDDHKAKIGRAHAGKVITADMRARISATLLGRVISEEVRSRMAAAGVGRVTSEATKAKLKAAALAQWKRKREE